MTFDFSHHVAVATSLRILHGSILTIEEREPTPAGPPATKESCAGGTLTYKSNTVALLGSIPFPFVDTSYARSPSHVQKDYTLPSWHPGRNGYTQARGNGIPPY